MLQRVCVSVCLDSWSPFPSIEMSNARGQNFKLRWTNVKMMLGMFSTQRGGCLEWNASGMLEGNVLATFKKYCICMCKDQKWWDMDHVQSDRINIIK